MSNASNTNFRPNTPNLYLLLLIFQSWMHILIATLKLISVSQSINLIKFY